MCTFLAVKCQKCPTRRWERHKRSRWNWTQSLAAAGLPGYRCATQPHLQTCFKLNFKTRDLITKAAWKSFLGFDLCRHLSVSCLLGLLGSVSVRCAATKFTLRAPHKGFIRVRVSVSGVSLQTKHDSLFLCKHRRPCMEPRHAFPWAAEEMRTVAIHATPRFWRQLSGKHMATVREAPGPRFSSCGGEPGRPGVASVEVITRAEDRPGTVQMMWRWGHAAAQMAPLLRRRNLAKCAHLMIMTMSHPRPCGRIKNEVFVQLALSHLKKPWVRLGEGTTASVWPLWFQDDWIKEEADVFSLIPLWPDPENEHLPFRDS